MNPFSFSMLQQPFNIHGNLNQITDYNPFGMGIPNNSQTAPYLQYSPYQQGQSPYTQWFGNQIANQGYDPSYYSNLMELMNQTPTAQYLEPFQQVAEDARTAQQTQEQPVSGVDANRLAELEAWVNAQNLPQTNVQQLWNSDWQNYKFGDELYKGRSKEEAWNRYINANPDLGYSTRVAPRIPYNNDGNR